MNSNIKCDFVHIYYPWLSDINPNELNDLKALESRKQIKVKYWESFYGRNTVLILAVREDANSTSYFHIY